MSKKNQIVLLALTIGMIGLSGCKTAIKQDLSPSLTPTDLTFPRLPKKYKELGSDDKPIYPLLISFEGQYQAASGVCLIERKVLFNDLQRINKTDIKLNRKWWELWK